MGPWSPENENYCQAAPKYIYYILTGVCLFILMAALIIYGAKWMWVECKRMRDIEVKLPGSLEQPPDVNMSHWSISGKDSNDSHIPADIGPDPDEQLLLDRKADGLINGDSSGCSSGQESVISSLASGTNLSGSAALDSGTEQPKMPSDEEQLPNTSSREGSLRLRKPTTTNYCVLGVGGMPETDVVTGRGYVPVPKASCVVTHDRKLPVHSGYVIAVDPKQLITRDKSTPLSLPTSSVGYSSVVPTSTLINIDPGALTFGDVNPNGNLSPDGYVKTEGSLQLNNDPVGSDYPLSSYCRLGLDGKSISPTLPLASRDKSDLNMITDQLDSEPTPRSVRTSEPIKGYVPHKHFDTNSKMLKGD